MNWSQENRRAKRYRVYLPASMADHDMVVNNISLSGLQLSCPEFTMDMVRSQFESGPVDLNLMPAGGAAFSIKAEKVYMDACDTEYLVGMRFAGLDSQAEQQLESYINTLPG